MMIYDARWEGSHGIGRFARELRGRLPQHQPVDLPRKPSSPLDPYFLSRYLSDIKPEMFFSPGYNPPLGSPCPFVFCVHDLNHLHVPDNSSFLKRAYYKYVIKPAISRSKRLITGSEFSKSQICDWSGIDPEHVVAVGYGVSDAFTSSGIKHSESNQPYFMCVGNEKSHKNLLRMIRAFSNAFLNSEYRLLCTGAPAPSIQAEIALLGIEGQVRFVGSVTDSSLAELYRGASALAFVSLYEGFGLPIIESMACGTPVLTSTSTATPEVAGGAAILVDPYDVDAISAGLRRLVSDMALRESLREKGLQRATAYSWTKTAAKVREVLATCV